MKDGDRDLEISLRGILRKIQLLRLDVLRHVQKQHNASSPERTHSDEMKVAECDGDGDNDNNDGFNADHSLNERFNNISTTNLSRLSTIDTSDDEKEEGNDDDEDEGDELVHDIYSEKVNEPRKYQSALLGSSQMEHSIMTEKPDLHNVMKAKSVGNSLSKREAHRHNERMQNIVERKEEEQDRIMKTNNDNMVNALLFANDRDFEEMPFSRMAAIHSSSRSRCHSKHSPLYYWIHCKHPQS